MEPIDTFEKIIYNSYYGKPYKTYDTYRKAVIEGNGDTIFRWYDRFLKQRIKMGGNKGAHCLIPTIKT